MQKLRPDITYDGQPFYDEPIYSYPTPINTAVIMALKGKLPPGLLIGYQRVKLNWHKPNA